MDFSIILLNALKINKALKINGRFSYRVNRALLKARLISVISSKEKDKFSYISF